MSIHVAYARSERPGLPQRLEFEVGTGLASNMRGIYTALAERSGGSWAITVSELRGVFSQAPRLDRVEAVARAAIARFLDVPPDSFDIEIRASLAPEIGTLVVEAIQARAEAEDRQRTATFLSREAARTLHRLGLPQRDIGRLLHLSHQRVAQLLATTPDA